MFAFPRPLRIESPRISMRWALCRSRMQSSRLIVDLLVPSEARARRISANEPDSDLRRFPRSHDARSRLSHRLANTSSISLSLNHAAFLRHAALGSCPLFRMAVLSWAGQIVQPTLAAGLVAPSRRRLVLTQIPKNSDPGFTPVTSRKSRALVHATYSRCRSVL